MPSDHSAVDASLGYMFQALQALIILVQAGDDQSVTLELTDDVTLHYVNSESRFQVAHSIKASLAEVTIKSAKLWKTIGIWASENSDNEHYFLLTCAPVSPDLMPLTSEADRAAIQAKLEEEAELVLAEHEAEIHKHKERITGCRAFMNLSPSGRAELLKNITLIANVPNITTIDNILHHELRNIARPEKRQQVITRLREYWMNRVCLSLTGDLPRHISKAELQQRIEELASTIGGNLLPDDYGTAQAPAEVQVPDVMRRQIELVGGGTGRINRAKTAHWKSRNQRQRWLDEDVSMAAPLNEFDKKLISLWEDRHAPMCDDTNGSTEEEKQQRGRDLLDWTHNDAPQLPVHVGHGPVPSYVIQGTYQVLADDLSVGWHPEYKVRLSTEEESGCDQ
jgi:ABC-3C protein